jgi:pseudouridine kinase
MKILILGASCTDIIGYSDKRIISYEANRGIVKITQGGFARTTAEYLSRMGLPVKFMTAVGDDAFGKNILANLAKTGIDISSCLILKNASTTANLSLIDAGGKLFASIQGDNISYMLNVGYVKNTASFSYDMLLVDDSLNIESLLYIADSIYAKIKIFQPVNSNIRPEITDILNKFDVIKLNKTQAETICGRLISSIEDAKRCAEYIINEKGLKKVFILLDDLGSVGADITDIVHVHAYRSEQNNTSEAESAYCAGIMFSFANGFTLYRSALFAQVCYSYTNNMPAGEREKFSLEEIWSMLLRGDKIIAKNMEY